jgi:hypothetical protein
LSIEKSDSEFGGLMAYFHVTWARLRFASLLATHSFAIPAGPDWYKEIRIVVDENGIDWSRNAFWDGELERIVFGVAVDYVSDSLVTYHEYSHALIDLIFNPHAFPTVYDPNSPVGELLATAANEGLADYLACSLKDYPIVLDGFQGARDLNVPFRFNPLGPRDAHEDSKALSTGLWELRQDNGVGVTVVDRCVLETLFQLRKRQEEPTNFGLKEAAHEMLDVDRKVFSGSHVARMVEVFDARGILQY